MFALAVIAVLLLIVYFYVKNETYCDREGSCFVVNYFEKNKFNLVKSKLLQFYNKLLVFLPSDDPRTERLKARFNINRIYEVYPNNIQYDTSFTINKGEEMGVCVRSGEDFYKIEKLEVILFVFIHELAHIMSITEQHTNEFWTNFKYLLKVSYDNNLLPGPIDYSENPEAYCSLVVDYNPVLDNTI